MNESFEWFCKICLIIFIIICLNSMLGDLVFWASYSFPKITETTTHIIDTSKDPIQNNLDGKKYIIAKGEKQDYALNFMAEYSISGMVVAKNSNFWFRDIMRSKFDDLYLIDFGIVWGDLAKDKKILYKHMKFKSAKTLGQARMLTWRWNADCPWDGSYIRAHLSHTHMTPANANVMGALLKIKKNNIVKIDGYLVDTYTDKSELIAHTSMSRTDNDPTSRGSGSCEEMYVTQVQIGDKIYK